MRSDFGRRIAQRRGELGLSTRQLEAAAGLGRGYVEYLESANSPNAGVETLARLASALHTSAEALTGSDVNVAPGRHAPAHHARLSTLSAEECSALLGERGIGRIVFVAPRGPVALPVNYTVIDGDVVFRTAADNTIDTNSSDAPVSFEVDHIDEASGEGWSVLLTGRLHRFEGAPEALKENDPTPWASGDRPVLLRLTPSERSGRRISAS